MFDASLPFLIDLAENNDRDWLLANKNRQKEAQEEFKEFVRSLYAGLLTFDSSLEGQDPVKSIFRIYRDVRFSKDKRPYKTNFGVFLKKGGKKSPYSGYYFHLEPKKSFIAGGIYMPPNDVLKKIREEIDYNPEEVKNLLSGKFKKLFGVMEGDSLKRPPRGYTEDHPMIDLIKHKSFLMMHQVDDAQLKRKSMLTDALKVYEAMKPWNNFINRSLD